MSNLNKINNKEKINNIIIKNKSRHNIQPLSESVSYVTADLSYNNISFNLSNIDNLSNSVDNNNTISLREPCDIGMSPQYQNDYDIYGSDDEEDNTGVIVIQL